LPLPADDPVRRRPDITLAKEVLGWEPTVQLREGLLHTIDYFRSSDNALRAPAFASVLIKN
jgi:UDP-glucuronate decarboxylase